MRIGNTLGLWALGVVLLAGCNGGGGGGSVNNATTEGTLVYSPPLRIASLTAAALTAQLSATPAGQQLLAVAGTPTCGVDFHYIVYATVGGAGETTQASGALMAPTGGTGCSGARPILEYAHGTATTLGYDIADPTATTNEAWPESVLIAAMFAAQGYVVVAPNYVGYDQPNVHTLRYHPYLDGAQQSRDMIDALAAARAALGGLPAGVSDNGKLFLTGYSQGGYVAMATHQAMQAAGMTVTAAAPMSGPYALEAFGDSIVFGNVDLGATVFLPLIINSYQHAYTNIYSALTDVYEPTYATGIDTLLPNAQPITSLFTQGLLPEFALFSNTATNLAPLDTLTTAAEANPLFAKGFGSSNLLTNTARVNYALDAFGAPDGALVPTAGVPLASPVYPLRAGLARNDMRHWTNPAAPMLLCGGHDDPTVFYSVNTGTMAAFWPAQVSGGLVTLLDVDPGAALSAGGIATQVTTIAATVYATDLAGGVGAAQLATDVQSAVVANFAGYFTISASGAIPNSPQGILVAGIAGVVAQAAVTDYASSTTDMTKVETDISTAIVGNYHGTLVPPACTVAARAFFAHF